MQLLILRTHMEYEYFIGAFIGASHLQKTFDGHLSCSNKDGTVPSCSNKDGTGPCLMHIYAKISNAKYAQICKTKYA